MHSRVILSTDIVTRLTSRASPLNLITIGRGVLLVDALVDDHPVLVHGVVASDLVLVLQLLELHLHVIIKKTNMRYSGYYQLNLYFLEGHC